MDEQLAGIVTRSRASRKTLQFVPFDGSRTLQIGMFRLKERENRRRRRTEAPTADNPVLVFFNIVMEELAKFGSDSSNSRS